MHDRDESCIQYNMLHPSFVYLTIKLHVHNYYAVDPTNLPRQNDLLVHTIFLFLRQRF